MLDLRAFVSKTISEIIDGVVEARLEAKAHGSKAVVVPGTVHGDGVVTTNHGEFITVVEFDLGVTEIGETETRGGLGVLSGIVNLGSSGQTTKGNEAMSRVRFAIPIKLPGQFDD